MESLLCPDTLHQLLPIPLPRSSNLPLSSIHRRTFSPAAAVNMDSKEFKLWGGRFEDSVTDAVEKFTESISFDKDLYKHDIMGNRAYASMLARQGLITEDDKNSILKGLDEIEGRAEFVSRTDREDVHMNIEAALTDLVGEPTKKLHTGRSRNDQVCTDFRLWCRDAIDNIVMRVKQLQLALENEGLRLMVPGYTHLQWAQPVLLQHPFLIEQLARYAGRLLDCRKRMNFFPLGACAFAGTGLPIDRSMDLEALGSIAPVRNRPNKDNDEGSSGGGNDKDNNEGSGGGRRGGNDIWIRTLVGVGLVGVVFYLSYKTGQAIEREIVGAVRDWKEAGFPALVNIKIEKVGLKFSIY